MVAQNGQSIEIGNACHTRQNKNQTKINKKRTQCALHTTIRKQTQITLIRHERSHKQLEVKTNPTSFICGIRNGNHNTELRTCLKAA